MHVVYLVNLKFKDCFSIDSSADIHIAIHIAIHRYVYQLMGVFCDRLLSYVLQQPPTARLAKPKADIANKSSHSAPLVGFTFISFSHYSQTVYKKVFLPHLL